MSKNVVIVESPAKAKTINKYLGSDYEVIASFGHIRDLPSKDGSVDYDNDFKMLWEVDKKGEKQLKEIISALKTAENLVLATDPDREGEAISWHIIEELKERGKIKKGLSIKRAVFHEITKNAILEAVNNPKELNLELVEAYLARRALDYLVGFNLSPLLWRKLPGSRSAGRVQSVALKLICEREDEIEKFKEQEYWSINGIFNTVDKKQLFSKLIKIEGKKLEKFDIPNESKALEFKRQIEQQDYKIKDISSKEVLRNPYPPFTTSTLQQESSRKLRFSAKKTMMTAQNLYEAGFITYMRTDAVDMAKEAVEQAREVIGKNFGNPYLPKSPRAYKNKIKNAQEAHEAIRPTDFNKKPEDLSKLEADVLKLYDLIYKRALASQMASAIIDQASIDINSADEKITFKATGHVIKFDGFMKLYNESKDDNEEDDEEKVLPKVKLGDIAELIDAKLNQHFTAAPPRYSEATLVKRLEELGIGRPSTYASIISVIQERNYVTLDKRKFIPQERGRIVTAFLNLFFPKYVQYNFTASMEDNLDEVAGGKLDRKELLKDFWTEFYALINQTKELKNQDILDNINKDLEFHFFPDGNHKCPNCEGGLLELKTGKFGAFIGCSNYPECKYTKQIASVTEEGEEPAVEDNKDLGENIFLKKGPYGWYVQEGADKKAKKMGLPKNLNPDDINLEKAKFLLEFPKDLGEDISLSIGRFGPYLKHNGKFTSLPKDLSIFDVNLEKAQSIIKNSKTFEAKLIGAHPKTGEPIELKKGRFGPYIKYGKLNVSLPKSLREKSEILLDEALELISKKEKA